MFDGSDLLLVDLLILFSLFVTKMFFLQIDDKKNK